MITTVNFFIFDKKLLTTAGIGLFSAGHICWLLFSCAFIVLMCSLSRRSQRASDSIRRTLGITVLLLEVLRIVSIILAGSFNAGWLPLHLCGIAIFIVFWHSLRPGALSGEILYSLCMPGAAFALIFPDWVAYPAANLLCIVSFLIHILLIAYPAAMASAGVIRPNARRLPACFLFLAALAGAVSLFNRYFSTNFMFLRHPAPGSPLEWFASFLGDPGYILGYLPMLAAVWCVLYLPLRFFRRNKD